MVKVAWVAGSTVGVQDLRGTSRGDWVVDNVVTGMLGVVGAAAALATVRPWGRRLPLWLVAPPLWVGAGLLAPFVVLIPAAGLFVAAGWWAPPKPAAGSADPVLAPWVFAVVYGSFIVLGAGLVLAFPAYARERLRWALTGTGPGATHGAQAALAWAAAVPASALAVLRLSWAFGGTAGLHNGPRDVWLRSGDVVTAAQLGVAVAGVLALVHGRGRPTVALAATWLGAGGMLGTGLLNIAGILGGDRWAPAGQAFATHAVGSFVTCLTGGVMSIVALFMLAARRPRGGPGGAAPVQLTV